jgi:ATP-dependent DNA helicase RecG
VWSRESANKAPETISDSELSTGAGLLIDGGLTYAALILFGTRQALGKYLAQAEVILEHHSNDASGPPQQREEYPVGLFLFQDDLWNKINLRNEVQHFSTVSSIGTFPLSTR